MTLLYDNIVLDKFSWWTNRAYILAHLQHLEQLQQEGKLQFHHYQQFSTFSYLLFFFFLDWYCLYYLSFCTI